MKCTNICNCRDRFVFTISLSLVTSIRTGPPTYAVTNGIALKLGVLEYHAVHMSAVAEFTTMWDSPW